MRRSCVPPLFYRHLLITNYYTYTHTHTHIYKDMHSPPHPRSLASVALNRQPDKRVCDQRREWLQDRMAACRSWITSPVAKSCVYGVLCAFVAEVFSCSHTVLPKEHSLGVIFFSSPSSCYAVFFFNSLSSCPVYPLVIYVRMLCMYGQVDG